MIDTASYYVQWNLYVPDLLSTKIGLSASMRGRACSRGTKSLGVRKGWLKVKAKEFLMGMLPAGDPA